MVAVGQSDKTEGYAFNNNTAIQRNSTSACFLHWSQINDYVGQMMLAK